MPEVKEIMYQYGIDDRSQLSLVSRASEGLLSQSFFDLAELSKINREELAGFLNLSLKTIIRYTREKKKLNPLNSEQIIKLLALYEKGAEIFGSIEEFNGWLHQPSYGLGNMVPYNLLTTISGIDLIHKELTAIEFGDLS